MQIECIDALEKEFKNPFNEFLSFQGKLQYIEDEEGLKMKQIDQITQAKPLMIIEESGEKESLSKTSLVSIVQNDEFKTISKFRNVRTKEDEFLAK